MRTIIHDLNLKDVSKINFNKEDKVIFAGNCKNNCIGCFSCWIKHPRYCIYKDEFSNIVSFISKSDEFILISKCRYGCYESNVKKVLERCIGYVLPYFTIREGEIHHMTRYNKNLKFTVYLYGDISKEDKICVEKLVKANSLNLNTSEYETKYFKNQKELIKCIH